MARNFDEEFPVTEEEGPSFILGGTEFHARKNLHPSWFLQDRKGLDQVVDFISRALVPEERDAFKALVSNPDSKVSLVQLGAIANFILSETSERNKEAAEASSP